MSIYANSAEIDIMKIKTVAVMAGIALVVSAVFLFAVKKGWVPGFSNK